MFQHLKLFIIMATILVATSSVTLGAEYNCTTCDDDDIRSLIAIGDCDTIYIKPGTFDWDQEVYIDKSMHIYGAGEGVTTLRGTGVLGWGQTDKFIETNLGTDEFFELDNMTITGEVANSSKQMFWIDGTFQNKPKFRIHDVTFSSIESRALHIQTVYGLIDHSNFYGILSHPFFVVGDGDATWTRSMDYGTDRSVIIEDCDLDYQLGITSIGVFDTDEGGRITFRHNTVKNYHGGMSHGANDSMVGYRGSILIEYYDNTLIADNHELGHGMRLRGGSYIIFNNSWTEVNGGVFGYGSARGISIAYYGSCPTDYCGSSLGPSGRPRCTSYPCLDQPGFGTNQTQQPTYIWNNTTPSSFVNSITTVCDDWSGTTSDGTCTGGTEAHATIIQQDREYFLSAKPGYSSYEYPHPLATVAPPVGVFPIDANGDDGDGRYTLSWFNSNAQPGDIGELYDDDGSFSTKIAPSSSGSSGDLIIYRAASGETPVISGSVGDGIELINKNYIKVEGITVRSLTSSGARFHDIANSNYIYIVDCIFNQATSAMDGWPMAFVSNSTYVQLDGNTYDGGAITAASQFELLEVDAVQHMLIIDNNILKATHDAFSVRSGYSTSMNYNVFKGNTIDNPWHRAFGIDTDGIGTTQITGWLIEGNIIKNQNRNTPSQSPYNPTSRVNNHLEGQYHVLRYNEIYNSDNFHDYFVTIRGTSNNWTYHNTGYNFLPKSGESLGGQPIYAAQIINNMTGNKVINNIIFEYEGNDPWDSDESIIVQSGNSGNRTGNTIENNILYRSAAPTNYLRWGDSVGSVSYMNSNDSQFSGNLAVNPLMTDPANADFSLQVGSPAIDAGTYLATVTGVNGSSNTLTVTNAVPFFSGPKAPWYIVHQSVSADTINNESGASCVIQGINYGTNIITCDTVTGFSLADQLTPVPYGGNAPDIGANESGGIGPPPGGDFGDEIETRVFNVVIQNAIIN